ncbi:DUF6443 domain-containing protein [Ekhidna sp.]
MFKLVLKVLTIGLLFLISSYSHAQQCQGVSSCPPGDDCGLITSYRDADGDGKGDPNVSLTCINIPGGYVSNDDDCDDSNASVWNTCCTKKKWYRDADNDNYGHASIHVWNCTRPSGYVANNLDCNDGNSSITLARNWYIDSDGDGKGADASSSFHQNLPPGELGTIRIVDCSQPSGYVANNSDCNDLDGNVQGYEWAYDSDGDGFGDPNNTYFGCDGGSSYVLNKTDCNDNSAVINPNTKWYKDADGDGYSDGTVVTQCNRPTNYFLASELTQTSGDCNDDPQNSGSDINLAVKWYKDQDGDGYSDGTTVTQCNRPNHYFKESELTQISGDCADNDETRNPETIWYEDDDKDSFGNPNRTRVQCANPTTLEDHWVRNANDCNDTDGHGPPTWYLDNDGDGYAGYSTITQCNRPSNGFTSPSDCDDENTSITTERIWFIDNDGDGQGADLSSPFHQGLPSSELGTVTKTDCDQPNGYVANNTDCNDFDQNVQQTLWAYDGDGDTFGDPNNTYVGCGSDGYVANTDDCDDSSTAINPNTRWYKDGDGDGYSNGTSITQCGRPNNYYLASELTATSGDCNDNNSNIISSTTWYRDGDGDGLGNSNNTTTSCTQPSGFVLTGGDCDDHDASIRGRVRWYEDADEDGFGNPNGQTLVRCTAPQSPEGDTQWVRNNQDCDDTDGQGPPEWYVDIDGDGAAGNSSMRACTQPPNTYSSSTDCDDRDPNVIGPRTWYVDNDGDGLGANMNSERNLNLPPSEIGEPTKISCDKPLGYVDNNLDCYDIDPNIQASLAGTYYHDADGDGFGDASTAMNSCEPLEGYVTNGDDCDDNEISGFEINPRTKWYKDRDGDGFSDGIYDMGCNRSANFFYLPSELEATQGDCDDDNPNINRIIWYKDQDNDNLGDPSTFTYNCNQPEGYVSNKHDECPNYAGEGNGCPDFGINYIKTRTARVAGVAINDIKSRPIDEVTLSTIYFDGLGNNLQQVTRAASPLAHDIVIPFAYDDLGRMEKEYLPYVASSATGAYQINALNESYLESDQYQFYQTTPGIAHDPMPYAQKRFENSPLSRVQEQAAPGQAWQVGGKSVKMGYDTNTGLEVILWNNDDFENLTGSFYKPGELMKISITDEDGNETITFTDKKGQVILNRSAVEEGVWADTYYIYDNYGRLRVVLQPEAIKMINENLNDFQTEGYEVITDDYYITSDDVNKKFLYVDGVTVKITPRIRITPEFRLKEIDVTLSQDALELWAFQYHYDGRHRMIEKKVPGADWVYMVYDRWDRLVLTQDGNQRENSEWLFTKYDELNRPVIAGIASMGGSLDQIRNDVKNGENRYEEKGIALHGYTNNALPTNSAIQQVHTVTYYDEYPEGMPVELNASYPADFDGAITSQSLKGQLTSSKTNVLGGEEFLWSSTYYDEKYRPLKEVTQNQWGDPEVIYSEYDFIGQVKKTRQVHDSEEYAEINERYEHDHTGRLLSHFHKLNEESEILLVANEYNELGQVLEKNIHKKGEDFQQSQDYAYNIRGWLKSINDPGLTDFTESHKDLFGMELLYNVEDGPLGNKSLFNGNISAMRWSDWSAFGSNQSRAYRYKYDQLNRLKSADHFINNNDVNKYDVSGLSYDLNGNIEMLKRRNESTTTYMDDLSYTYSGNRLMMVSDEAGEAGFEDGNTSGEDYQYDANGNMITDLNKEISSISYNHLNLAERIDFQNGDYVLYSYDAAGIKMSKEAVINGESSLTDYIGNFIYENDTLQFIQHVEGRIMPLSAGHPGLDSGSSEGWDYQYHLTDHLGNTRLTFSTTPENYTMVETFESGEENGFQALNRLVNSNANTTSGGNEVQVLSHYGEIGGMILLNLNKGDTIHLKVNANYENSASGNTYWGIDPLDLFDLVEGTYMGLEGAVDHLVDEDEFMSAIGGMADKSESSDAPRAYLNYILWDEGMNYVSSGFQQINTVAQGIGTTETIGISDIIADREGYILAYLSNENQQPINIHFDDFTVYHGKTNVVQSDDYYPFGLTYNSTSRMASEPQHFLYNGKELQPETGWVDYGARMHDPALGRWFNVDPLAEAMRRHSPYNYAFDNPIRYIDPDGMMGTDPNDEKEQDPNSRKAKGAIEISLFKYLVDYLKKPEGVPDEVPLFIKITFDITEETDESGNKKTDTEVTDTNVVETKNYKIGSVVVEPNNDGSGTGKITVTVLNGGGSNEDGSGIDFKGGSSGRKEIETLTPAKAEFVLFYRLGINKEGKAQGAVSQDNQLNFRFEQSKNTDHQFTPGDKVLRLVLDKRKTSHFIMTRFKSDINNYPAPFEN